MERKFVKELIESDGKSTSEKVEAIIKSYNESKTTWVNDKDSVLGDKKAIEQELETAKAKIAELEKTPNDLAKQLEDARTEVAKVKETAKAEAESEYKAQMDAFKKNDAIEKALKEAGAKHADAAVTVIGKDKFEALEWSEDGTKLEGLDDIVKASKSDKEISYLFDGGKARPNGSLGGASPFKGDEPKTKNDDPNANPVYAEYDQKVKEMIHGTGDPDKD